MNKNFVHLHVHSEYSLLDGACRIPDVVRTAAEFGMPAVALTDHGVLYGALEFYFAAKSAGVKPIVGCEMYVAPRGRFDRTVRDEHHLTVLAADREGYVNLMKLVSAGFTEGYYYKPRVDLELLERHHRGLIVLSGCLGSAVSQSLVRDDPAAARELVLTYRQIFGKRYYIELHHHRHLVEDRIRPGLIALGRQLDVPLVATNDFHYLRRDDSDAHDVLLCIGTGRMVSDSDRLRFEGDQFYFKTADEMRDLFADVPEACDNTTAIADSVSLDLDSKTFSLPSFPVPADASDENAYLRRLCEQGLRERYGEPSAAHVERLEYELGVIQGMGFASYFLIVWDFIRFARERAIPVGPGRGSAAGSIVAYALRISDVDPLRYNLFFERFLNPERISMPDIDTDFCFERRDEVIDYVRGRYGSDRVAQIVTFGTMAARAAVRDVGRVMGVPLPEVDRLAKLIPNVPTNPVTISQAIESVPDLMTSYRNNPQARSLLDTAMKVEGLARHVSTHAAGVVIAPGPITDFAPLVKLGDDDINTQYSMEWVERVGLLKMDFLGLRTLTVIEGASQEIRRTVDPSFSIDDIPLDDPTTYALLSSGQTTGVFQLESAGMRRYIAELKPTRIEDLIAMVALYRPGPMDWIGDFIAGKHGRRKITYLHPKLEPILAETYGIACYQEQVMQMCRDLAGYTGGQADEMRKVIGKKKKDLIPKERAKFMRGCVANGIDEQLAERIWLFIEPFAGYGFNKAHSVCYALLAYRTAWLKANHPVAFMASLLTSVKNNTDKVVEYLAECTTRGVKILPPDVNESGIDFTTAGDAIRFGLGAVRNVGDNAIRELIRERERGRFVNLAGMCARVDTKSVNRRVLESLVKAGALDTFGPTRAQHLTALDAALDYGQKIALERELGQTSLFGGEGEDALPPPAVSAVPEPPLSERLAQEKEAVGFYISGHPLAEKGELLGRCTSTTIRGLRELPEDELVTIGGVVIAVRRVVTKAGGQMLVAKLEDMTGAIEVVLFPKTFVQLSHLFNEDAILVVKGRLRERRPSSRTAGVLAPVAEADDDERAELSVQAVEAMPLGAARVIVGMRVAATLDVGSASRVPPQLVPPLGQSPELHVRLGHGDDDKLERLRMLVNESEDGAACVVLHAGDAGVPRRLRRGVALTPALREQVRSLFGPGNVWEAAS